MSSKRKLLAALGIFALICGCSRKETAPVPTDAQPETVAVQTAAARVPAKTEAALPPETETATLPETEPTEPQVVQPPAQRITDSTEFWLEQVNIAGKVADNNHLTRVDFRSSRNLTLNSQEPFGAVYMMWDTVPGRYTTIWDGGSMECGENSFLHEYIVLPEDVTSVTLSFLEENTST